MKTAHFEYKCRRCGKIEKNPHCAAAKAIGLLIVAMECENITKAPAKYDYHICEDGGHGVADLIGYGIKEDN